MARQGVAGRRCLLRLWFCLLSLLPFAGCSDPDRASSPATVASRPVVYTVLHTRPDGFRTQLILTVDGDGSNIDTVLIDVDEWGSGVLDPPGLVPQVPAWSRDGEWITFLGLYAMAGDSVPEREGPWGTVRSTTRGQIFIVRKDGSDLRQLTEDAYFNTSPDWAPDGARLVYTSQREGGTEIFLIDTAGTIVQRLSDGPGRDGAADWSPDGRHLVFTSTRESGHGLYIMAADGSNVRWLTAGIKPTWSPDGSRIAFHAPTCATLVPRALDDEERCRATGAFGVKGNQALWLIDPDGSNLKRVWPPDGEFGEVRTADGRYRSTLGHYPLYPVWSPDGEKLAFHAPRPFYATDPSLQSEVEALVLADSVWRESAEDLTPEAFEWLYAHTFEREITIIVVDTAGVEAREVTFGALVRP